MSLRALHIVLFLQISLAAQAQLSEADSLESIIKTIPSDTAKVWHLNRLVNILREQDTQTAMTYAQEAKNLALLINYERGLAYALENLGWINYRQGDYARAFQLSASALEIGERLNDLFLVANCLNSIAAINFEQNQFDQAIANFKKAFFTSAMAGDDHSMARSINNVAYVFLKSGQLDSARYYVKQGFELGENAGSSYLTGFAYRILGDIEYQGGRYSAAMDNYREVVRLAAQINNTFLKVSTLHRIGKTHVQLGEDDKALTFLLSNITLARKAEFRSELELSLKLLSEIYAARGDIGRAFDYQTQYINLHDSLYRQQSAEQLALMQVRFDSEMKEAKIELLTKNTQLKQEELNNQRAWMYFSIGSLTLMAILAFVLLYSNRAKKLANDVLALKNAEIEEQAQQLRNLNITKDKLFSIISHDLRSPLASLRGLIDILDMDGLSREDFKLTFRKLGRNLESVQDDLDNLLLWAQSQLKGLQSDPVSLRVHPIIDEKIRLFNEIAHQKEITINNEIDRDLLIVADRNHMALVMRNLLANAIKFSRHGGLISIRERNVGENVEISVTDTGVGMSTAEVDQLFSADTHFTKPGTNREKGVGIGLLLTKEFVEKNGGSIWATSELGKGSTFTFSIRQDYRKVAHDEIVTEHLVN
jgi:signal transduction histidine kinase